MMRESKWMIFVCLGILVSLTAYAKSIKIPEPSQPAAVSPEKKITSKPYAQFRLFKIDHVSVFPGIFNPGKNEKISISFRLSRPGSATVNFFDAEMSQVAEIEAKEENTGLWSASWDGKDLQGNLVPDSAYFFTITARDHQKNLVLYDPTQFSGGAGFMPSDLVFNIEIKQIAFSLKTSAWVRIRAGIPKGPLLANILNWIPYPAGGHSVDWDGADRTGNFIVSNQPGWKLMAGAISLPENSVIATGNTQYDFLAYKDFIAQNRPRKAESSHLQSSHLQTREKVRFSPMPTFEMDLPGNASLRKNGLRVVSGTVPIRITLDHRVKHYAMEQRYEIMIFVDFQFVSEEDDGYSPATRIWDSRSVPDGEHVITANVRLLGANAESASMHVWVQNASP